MEKIHPASVCFKLEQTIPHQLLLFFSTKDKRFSVKVNCPMGEQLQARPITEQDFIKLQSTFSTYK